MAELVRSKVAAGEYATESEVIRDGLRTLAARDKAVEAWLLGQVLRPIPRAACRSTRCANTSRRRGLRAPADRRRKLKCHFLTEGLRVQLADTSVRVIELAPPGVRTTLFGQETDENAMPLGDFLDEALALLHGEPTLKKIIVEQARFLRTAEAIPSRDDRIDAIENGKTDSAWVTVSCSTCTVS